MVKIRLVQRDGVLNQSFNFLILNDKAAMHLATFVSEMTSFIFFLSSHLLPFSPPLPHCLLSASFLFLFILFPFFLFHSNAFWRV